MPDSPSSPEPSTRATADNAVRISLTDALEGVLSIWQQHRQVWVEADGNTCSYAHVSTYDKCMEDVRYILDNYEKR